MKRFLLTILIGDSVGLILFLLFNFLNIRPLNFNNSDPNSNAAIIAILYFIIGAVMLGAQSNYTGMNIVSKVQYLKEGYKDDMVQQNNRFPVAIGMIANGIIFIVLYLILNRINIR